MNDIKALIDELDSDFKEIENWRPHYVELTFANFQTIKSALAESDAKIARHNDEIHKIYQECGERYGMETKRLQAQLNALMESCVKLNSHTLPPIIIFSDEAIIDEAKAKGEL